MLAALMAGDPTVHTAGINWESFLGIIGSISTFVALAAGYLAKQMRTSMTKTVRDVIRDEVSPQFSAFRTEVTNQLNAMSDRLDELSTADQDTNQRVAKLEGIEEGKRAMVSQQNDRRDRREGDTPARPKPLSRRANP